MIKALILFCGLMSAPDTVEIDSMPDAGFYGYQVHDTIEFIVNQNDLIDAQKTNVYLDSICDATSNHYFVTFSNSIRLDEPLILRNVTVFDANIKLDGIHAAFILKDSSGVRNCIINTNNSAPSNHYDNWGFAGDFVNKEVIEVNGHNCIVDSVTITKGFGSGIDLTGATRVTVSNCFMMDNWIHGWKSGTQGYHINLVESHNNHITRNTSYYARHGIVVQYNSSYNHIKKNVVKYSYALKKWWVITWKDYTYTYNITLHGNGAHHNLFQSNNCERRLVADNIKQISNGHGNIFYQNVAGEHIRFDKNNNFGYILGNSTPKVINRGKNNTVIDNAVIKWK